MNKILPLIVCKSPLQRNSICGFNTSAILCANQLIKQAKFMNKFMSKGNSKRKWYSNPDAVFLSPAKSLSKTKGEPAKTGRRRVTVLNKLFMKYVTDIMTTGDIARHIHGRQIEISKVSIAPDFNLVNVFWITKGVPEDEETEKVLAQIAGDLRHELSQLKIIGMVPKLQFVKDKQYAKIMEMEVQLSKADFGEDFVPTDPSFLMKSEFTLNSRLEPHLLSKIKKMEENEEIENVILSPMRNDIFGLDRDKLMGRITQSMNKSREAWSKVTEPDINIVNVQSYIPGVTNNQISSMTSKEQKQQFYDFLKRREIMRKKTEDEIKLAHKPLEFNLENANEHNFLDYDEEYDEPEYTEEINEFPKK